MTRLNLVLLVVLIVSSLYLVRTAYEQRRLFAEIERAKSEAARLHSDEIRLQAEREAQATNLRVERVARERLQMRTASPAVTQYLGAEGRAASVAASGAAQ